ncbi:MAG: acetolactate synthase small subunit [Candidatus Omnitrophota bacterium]
MKHTICALVENKFGVLARIAGLFSARGFNISSLTVGETEDPSVSRMTIIVEGDDRTLEQIKKQLHKLIDVITVYDLTKKGFVDRELLLIKVSAATPKIKEEIAAIAETLEAKTVNVGAKSITLELTGEQEKIKSAFELLAPFGIREVVRTGRIAMALEERKEPIGGK